MPSRLSEGESRYAAIDIEQIYRMQALKQEELNKKARDLKQNPQRTIIAVKEAKAPQQSSDESDSSSIQDSDLSDFYQNTPLSVDGQLRVVFRITFCQVMSMLSFKFSVIINAFFISLAGYYNIETKENTTALIKGIGLANIIISILCFGISQGLNGALETLVSQAYGASKNMKESERFRDEMRKLCGQYLNIARLVNTLFMIFPTAILALFADEILITFFKQNAFVSEIAIQYCIICMPGVWAMTQFDATKRFLSAQNHGAIPMITQLFTGCIQILCCYLFMIQFQWGLLGAAIATNITFIMNMAIQDFWIAMHSETVYKDMWLQWARSSLDGLGQFLEYGIPSAMMECFLLCALQVFVFMSGYGLGRKSQNQFSVSEREDFSAQVVIMNIFNIIYMLPQGISYTISALVGSLQAENKPNVAKKYATVAYYYGQFLIFLVIIVLSIYGHTIFRCFVNNQETVHRIMEALPAIFMFMFLQSSFGLLTGVIKGLGLQGTAALWTFIGYFVVGLPLASFFAFGAQSFFGWQKSELMSGIHNLKGLYIGFIIGCIFLNISFLYIICSVNWKSHAKHLGQIFEQYKFHNHQSYERLLSHEALSQQTISIINSNQDKPDQERLLPRELDNETQQYLPSVASDCYLSIIDTALKSESQEFTLEEKAALKKQLDDKDDEYEGLLFEDAVNSIILTKDQQRESVGHGSNKCTKEQRRMQNLRKYI